MNKDFSKLCTPAKLYFAIAVISCLIALIYGLGIIAVFMKLVFAFIWTYILSFLCSKGFQSVSWFLVLFPYIIILLGVIGFMRLSNSQRGMLNSVKFQGAFGQEHFTNNKNPVAKNPMMVKK
jgi:hypothetical protein